MSTPNGYTPIDWEKEFGMTKEEYDAWEDAEFGPAPKPEAPLPSAPPRECSSHAAAAPCACDVSSAGGEEAAFRAALDEAKKKMRPKGMTEEMLVESVVLARWRLKRFLRAETSLLGGAEGGDDALKRLALVERMRASAQREMFRALREIRMHQAERRKRRDSRKKRAEARRLLMREKKRRQRERKRPAAGAPRRSAGPQDDTSANGQRLTANDQIKVDTNLLQPVENKGKTTESCPQEKEIKNAPEKGVCGKNDTKRAVSRWPSAVGKKKEKPLANGQSRPTGGTNGCSPAPLPPADGYEAACGIIAP